MKTNHFLLAAGISFAMAFTLSCSDDDKKDGEKESKEYVFCNTTVNGLRMCTEITVGGDFTKSQLETGACTGKGGTLADKCENTELKCPMSDKGLDMVIYLYEYPTDVIKNCEDFGNLPK